MRLGRLDDERLGLVTDAGFIDIQSVFKPDPRRPYTDPMVQLIERWEELKSPIAGLESSGSAEALNSVKFGPPLRRPRKIVHLTTEIEGFEAGQKPPIDWFFRSPESVTGPTATIVFPPHYATEFVAEAEVAAIIGKRCYMVPPEEADSVVFGYTALLDAMGEGLGRGAGTYLNKSFDTFCPMGPSLVVNDGSVDHKAFTVRLEINGARQAEYSVGQLAHSLGELIASASSFFWLLPGDLVTLGSPTNQNFKIAHRDSISVDVSAIGFMSLTVDDPLCRHRERVA
jgi:2-keto-4-pentenoate hydratase/2-oxohepta-3-ene-1,7-dioic acid hydratase in catechol pathway